MELTIRAMTTADLPIWAQMRDALWPGETADAHAKVIGEMLGGDHAWGFIAEFADGTPVGFAELAVRDYANGCDGRPVPFLEAIWVKPPWRWQGIGARLIQHIEAFVAARGFQEIGSDTLIDNAVSQAVHRSWGFLETERVVYFRKLLKPVAR
jgi:aminoglycoside 6'-N-acetyltransferase I